MKRMKKLLVLLGVLIILCVGIGIATGVEKHIDRISGIDEEIIAVDTDALESVSLTKDGKTLTFEKKEDQWKDKEDEAFPIDQDKMQEFLEHFQSVKASFQIQDVEDLEQYGLTKPQCTIAFHASEENTEIRLGDFSTMDSKRYVTLDDKTVYLIDEDLSEYVSTKRDDFMKQDAVPEYDQIQQIAISGGESLQIDYLPDEVYSYTDKYDYYLVDGDSHKAVSTVNVESFLTRLKNLDVTDYVNYQVTEEELAEYGLDEPKRSVKVTYTKEDAQNSFTIDFGKKKDKNYFRMNDSNIVYQLEEERYQEILDAGYETFRPSEVVALDWDLVKTIKIKMDDQEYTVDHKGKNYKLDGETVEFDEVIRTVDDLILNEEVEESKLQKEEIAFEIELNQKEYDRVSVSIYQYDGENCAVQVDGETVGLVTRELVVDFKEAVNKVILG